jgi:adenosine kinase
MVATFCLETKGTQEYLFDRAAFMERFLEAYGAEAADEVAHHINPRMGL